VKKLAIKRKRTTLFLFLSPLFILLLVHPGSTAEEIDEESLYRTFCAACHGMDGVPRGLGMGAPSFKDEKWKNSASTEKLVQTIAQGKMTMPPFKRRLTGEQIKAIADYLKTL